MDEVLRQLDGMKKRLRVLETNSPDAETLRSEMELLVSVLEGWAIISKLEFNKR